MQLSHVKVKSRYFTGNLRIGRDVARAQCSLLAFLNSNLLSYFLSFLPQSFNHFYHTFLSSGYEPRFAYSLLKQHLIVFTYTYVPLPPISGHPKPANIKAPLPGGRKCQRGYPTTNPSNRPPAIDLQPAN